jgi:hypothetical protein
MNHDDKCLVARQCLYSAISQLRTQADISQEAALTLITEYAAELTAFVINDGAKIRALCENAALDGMAAKRQYLAHEAKKEAAR